MFNASKMKKPETKDHLEDLCQQLYHRHYDAITCVKIGRSGQSQSGVDLIAKSKRGIIGIQCKAYHSTKFTKKTVESDIEKADKANISITHLLFATTADNDSNVTLAVSEISAAREIEGKFSVSIDYWGDISSHLTMHPDVATAFIDGYSGSISLRTHDNTNRILEITTQSASDLRDHISRFDASPQRVSALQQAHPERSTPASSGSEADTLITMQLDLIRDRIRAGKTKDARDLLDGMGDYTSFRDDFSKFRFLTNQASIDLEDGRVESGAQGFIEAARYAPTNELALANKAHGYLLNGKNETALATTQEALHLFPANAGLWAIRLHASYRAGTPIPDSDIPQSLILDSELLYSRALLFGGIGEHEKAISMAEKLIEIDPINLSNRRLFLTEALSLATKNALHASLSHSDPSALMTLGKAVKALEPLEDKIHLQSDGVSLELAVNLSTALRVLGEYLRSAQIASSGLQRHPNDESLVRAHLAGIEANNGPEAVRQWARDRFASQSTDIIMILLDVASSLGDSPWFSELERELISRDSIDSKTATLKLFKAKLILVTSGEDDSIAYSRDEASRDASNIPLHLFLAQLLYKRGLEEDARLIVKDCVGRSEKNPSDLLLWQIGTVAQQLHLYVEASAAFERLLKFPGEDELTRRLLYCYTRSNQNAKAIHLLDAMPMDVRESEYVLHTQCELAQSSSDWKKLREISEKLMKIDPDEIAVCLAHAMALHRLDKISDLREFLSPAKSFSSSALDYEAELAKYELACGLHCQALQRAFVLFAKNPQSPKAAGYFLINLLNSEAAHSPNPASVQISSEVSVRHGAETRKIVIFDLPNETQGWAEIVPSTSQTAASMLGKNIGENVAFRSGLLTSEGEVTQIRPAYLFGADKANEVLSSAAENDGPVWTLKAIGADGRLDADQLVSMVSARKQSVGVALEGYKNGQLPISCMSAVLNMDCVCLLHQLPLNQTLWVSSGRSDDMARQLKVLASGPKPVVIDLFTMAEVVHRNLFDEILATLGQPLVAQSTRDAIAQMISMPQAMAPSGLLGERGGRLQYEEMPSSVRGRWCRYLVRIQDAIDRCKVVPVQGPVMVNAELESTRRFFERSTFDSINLCIERDAIFFCEDLTLRSQTALTGINNSASLQAVMIHSRAAGKLPLAKYAEVIIDKICSNHSFLSVTSKDLYSVASKPGGSSTSRVCKVLRSLGNSRVDFQSGLQVAIEFLSMAARALPPQHVARFARAALDGLCRSNPESRPMLLWTVSYILNSSYGRNGRRLSTTDRKPFGELLPRTNARKFLELSTSN